jgi:hypothetical protein
MWGLDSAFGKREAYGGTGKDARRAPIRSGFSLFESEICRPLGMTAEGESAHKAGPFCLSSHPAVSEKLDFSSAGETKDESRGRHLKLNGCALRV